MATKVKTEIMLRNVIAKLRGYEYKNFMWSLAHTAVDRDIILDEESN